jgi:small-conductance mechanosensitive channel
MARPDLIALRVGLLTAVVATLPFTAGHATAGPTSPGPMQPVAAASPATASPVTTPTPSGSQATATSPQVALAPATVRFFNRDIVTLRAPYFGFFPADRAAQSANRIHDAVARGGPGTVKMVPTKEGLTVSIDGVYVFRILEGDLDAEDGETFDQARKIVGGRLEAALAASREAMRGRELVRAFGLSMVATLGLCLVIWLLGRGRAWLRRRLTARLTRHLRLTEHDWTMLVRAVRTIGHFVFLAVAAVLAEEWLRFVFGLFPYTRPWSERLTGYVATSAAQIGASVVDAVPGLLMVAIIAGLAHLSSKILGAVALGVEAGRYRLPGIDVDTVYLARRLAVVIVWLFALAMAYPYLPGSSSDAFKGVSVLVGLMLSLGASGLVGQAAGGFILTFGHVLRPGDWMRVGDVEGAVTSVGMFSTRLRTPMDEDVNVPNSVLLSSVSRNFSRPAAAESSILETSVTIGYNTPWRQVHAMLLDAAARTLELEREPPPHVLQTSLSDFYVQYSLRARLRDQRRRPAVLSMLNANVQDVFNEYGVQIMSPHYRFDPPEPVVVPKERWFEPPAPGPGDSPRRPDSSR